MQAIKCSTSHMHTCAVATARANATVHSTSRVTTQRSAAPEPVAITIVVYAVLAHKRELAVQRMPLAPVHDDWQLRHHLTPQPGVTWVWRSAVCQTAWCTHDFPRPLNSQHPCSAHQRCGNGLLRQSRRLVVEQGLQQFMQVGERWHSARTAQDAQAHGCQVWTGCWMVALCRLPYTNHDASVRCRV